MDIEGPRDITNKSIGQENGKSHGHGGRVGSYGVDIKDLAWLQ